MLSYLTPARYVARRLLSSSVDLKDIARVKVLCAAEESRAVPAVILDGALARCRNFLNDEEEERTHRSLAGGVMRHEPSIAFTLRNATIAMGSVYAGGGRLVIRRLRESLKIRKSVELKSAALCTSATGDLFFGHFATEDLLQILIADQFGRPIRLRSRDWPHLPAYKEAFELAWDEIEHADIGTLTYFSDFAQNSLRQDRYRRLRNTIRRKLTPANAGARIYLRRGSTGAQRAPLNDEEVAERLISRGFVVVDLKRTPPTRLLEQLLDAKVIVSVEGSQFMHAVYTLAENGAAAILMPPNRPQIQNKDRFDALGVPTAIIVGVEDDTGYNIRLDELDWTLDRLEQRIAKA